MSIKKIVILGLFVTVTLFVRELLPDEMMSLDYFKAQHQSLLEYTTMRPYLSAIGFLIAYVLVAALNLPIATFMSLLGGALFGLGQGTLLVSFGSTVGATISFILCRFFFRESIETKFPEAVKKIDRGIEREGSYYLFALRMVPIFPFFLINTVMGLTRLSIPVFFIVSQIGMLPGTLAYVYAGTQLGELTSSQSILSPRLLAAFVFIGLLPIFSRLLLDYLRARKLYKKYQRPDKFDYNVIAIGGGAAGLVTSYIAAAVKAKALLIEKHRMGGDCLNTGCVPSKALIKTAKVLHSIRTHEKYGLSSASCKFSFSDVMERVDDIIRKIEPHDSVERYTELGVDCVNGTARVIDPFRVQVDDKIYTTRNIVIATGAKPIVPNVPGLAEVSYYTSDTIWQIREQPKRLLVIGGGPVGCELGQAFQRLGTQVTIVQRNSRLLVKENTEVSKYIADQLTKEGVQLLLSHELSGFDNIEGEFMAICRGAQGETHLAFDAILFALGREANTRGFGLEELSIGLREDGTLETDEFLRTKYQNIFACGDVTGPFQLTHASAHQAWYASVNALFQPFKKYTADYRVIPRVTFTDPEVAHVGLTAKEAEQHSIQVSSYTYGLDDLDRAITESEAQGFVTVLTKINTDEIVGATIVGANAGEYLSEFTLAMKYKIGLNKILGTVHPYPTFSEANKYTAGIWKKAEKPEKLLGWVQRFHAWRRG